MSIVCLPAVPVRSPAKINTGLAWRSREECEPKPRGLELDDLGSTTAGESDYHGLVSYARTYRTDNRDSKSGRP